MEMKNAEFYSKMLNDKRFHPVRLAEVNSLISDAGNGRETGAYIHLIEM